MAFTLIIADDHDLIREGIRSILSQDTNFKVIEEARDGEEALQKTKKLRPDFLLLDITMPKVGGLDIIEKVRRCAPSTRIVILSVHKTGIYIRKAVKLGVRGYLHKENAAEELLPALRMVARGKMYLSPEISSSVLEEALTPQEKSFTSREEDILRLIVEGKTAKEIAKTLSISVRTVENYKNRLLKKLGLRRSADLIKYALEHKLV